jgi:uncharacterized FlaG/YvyC family protein
MEEYYTYFGYVVIVILLYFIYQTISRSEKREGFLGFGNENSGDNSSNKNATKNKNNNKAKHSKNSGQKKPSTAGPFEHDLQEIIDKLNEKTKDTTDTFNLVKDRKLWEDMILSVEDRINSMTLAALPFLSRKMTADPNDDTIEKTIGQMNMLNTFRSSLTDNMNYLDGLK